MSALVFGLIFAAGLSGQAAITDEKVSKLRSTLIDLSKGLASTQELLNHMTALAGVDKHPARPALAKFAAYLALGLKGKDLTKVQIGELEACIMAALRGQSANLVSVIRLNTILTEIRVSPEQIKKISTPFLAVCEDIRGPDDMKVKFSIK